MLEKTLESPYSVSYPGLPECTLLCVPEAATEDPWAQATHHTGGLQEQGLLTLCSLPGRAMTRALGFTATAGS